MLGPSHAQFESFVWSMQRRCQAISDDFLDSSPFDLSNLTKCKLVKFLNVSRKIDNILKLAQKCWLIFIPITDNCFFGQWKLLIWRSSFTNYRTIPLELVLALLYSRIAFKADAMRKKRTNSYHDHVEWSTRLRANSPQLFPIRCKWGYSELKSNLFIDLAKKDDIILHGWCETYTS